MAIIPIFHSKRELSSHNISCSRTQRSSYGIVSIRGHHHLPVRRQRRLCTRCRGHLSSQIADYCSRRVGYCESEEGDIEWRAEQRVSDIINTPRAHAHGRLTHSNCFLGSMATFPSLPDHSLLSIQSLPYRMHQAKDRKNDGGNSS